MYRGMNRTGLRFVISLCMMFVFAMGIMAPHISLHLKIKK